MLRLKMIKEVLAGNNLPVDQIASLLRSKLLDEVELDKEEDTYLSWPLNGIFQPLEKYLPPLRGEMKVFARWTRPLRFQLCFNIPQAFKLFQKCVHLAHLEVNDLFHRAVSELLEHLIAMHRLTFEQPQNGIFCWFADVHSFSSVGILPL